MKSFRLRIVLWYTGIAVVTLVLFRLASVKLIQDSLYDELDNSLGGEIAWMKRLLTTYKSRDLPDEEIRQEILERSRLSPRKEFIEIYDVQGQEYFRSPNLDEQDTLRTLSAVSASDTLAIIHLGNQQLRLITSKDQGYEMYIGYPLTDIETASKKILSSLVVLMPVAILMFIGGGLFLATRFVQPIKELRIYAEELVHQPLDQDLPEIPVRTKDEVGLLVAQINQMTHQLRTSMKQVLGFSTLASHELRTPLAIVRNELEEVLQEGTTTEVLRDTLASVYDETLRLSRIVDDLMSLGTMQAGTFRLNPARTRLDAILEEFCDEAVALCLEKRITLTRELIDHVYADVDVERFRYVLFNLLDNALKHTPEGGSITLQVQIIREVALLNFSDTGRGIPEDQLPFIFDPFRRVNGDSVTLKGTGLGLALVKWIVEAHRGTIFVENTGVGGTTICISLPLARDVAPPGYPSAH